MTLRESFAFFVIPRGYPLPCPTDLRSLVRNRLSLIDSTLINSSSANVTFRSILQEIGNVSPTLCEMHELGSWDGLSLSLANLHVKYNTTCITGSLLMCMSFTVSQFWTKFFRKRKEAQQYLDAPKTEAPGLLYLILFLHDLGKDEGPVTRTRSEIILFSKGLVSRKKCMTGYSLLLETI